MPMPIAKELALLHSQSAGQLRARYAELFGDSTRAKNKLWLVRRIAWRLQSLAEGDLSERARQRAAELANDADLRLLPPRVQPAAAATPPPTEAGPTSADPRLPSPGTILLRPYKGRTLPVKVLVDGFEFDGRNYPTLSAVAKAVTGTHTNGFLFFRLGQYKGEPR